MLRPVGGFCRICRAGARRDGPAASPCPAFLAADTLTGGTTCRPRPFRRIRRMMKVDDRQRLLADVEAFCQEVRPAEELCYVEHRYNDQVIPLAKKHGLLAMPV